MTVVAGLSSSAFPNLSSDVLIRLARDAGIDTIEWGGRHLPPGDLAAAEVIDTECADAGIQVGAYHSDYVAGSTHDPGGGPNQDPDAVLDSAAELGAKVACVWAGNEASAAATSANREAVVTALTTLCDEAASYRLQISLPFHPTTLTDTTASTLSLLQAVNRDNLFVHWRCRPGLSPEDAEREVTVLAGHLSFMYVLHTAADGEPGALADGERRWPPLLRHLSAATNRWPLPRWAVIERVKNDSPDQLIADAATLTRWLGMV